jgi:hypothetical protein
VTCSVGTTCQGGQCITVCANPLSSCGEHCVDLQTDFANCGGCGSACPTVSGVDSRCENAHCVITCQGASSNCDGDISNGCETPLAHCHKRVFVSSAVYTGNLGGVAGADTRCQALADAATLGGTYKAWMSDEAVSARDRLTHSTDSYVLLSGQVIAANWDALVVVLDRPIDETEQRGAPSTTPGLVAQCDDGPAVMTGTFGDGTIAGGSNCNNWTDGTNSSLVGFGNTSYVGSLWTAHCASPSCGVPLHLYCFEQ